MPVVEARTPTLPLELPPGSGAGAPTFGRVLRRRTLLAASAGVAVAVLLALPAAQYQASDEIDSALAAARLSRYLGNLPQLSDAQALAVLRQTPELQHLRLRVVDGEGQIRIGAGLAPAATQRTVAWTVARPEGPPWTVALVAAPDSDWAPTLLLALRDLVWFCLGAAGVLGALFWTLARDPDPLRALTGKLQRAERLHRAATRQLLEAQARERSQLAAGLQEGLRDRLSALRLDTIWLRRQLAANPQCEPVIGQLLAQLAAIPRALAKLLQPLLPPPGLAEAAGGHATIIPQHLEESLQTLLDESGHAHCRLQFDSDAPVLPVPLALAVYRMSQQALQLLPTQAEAEAAASSMAAAAAPPAMAAKASRTATPFGNGMASALMLVVHLDHSSRSLSWTAQALGGTAADSLPSDALALLRAAATAFEAELRVEFHPQGGWRLRAVLALDS